MGVRVVFFINFFFQKGRKVGGFTKNKEDLGGLLQNNEIKENKVVWDA